MRRTRPIWTPRQPIYKRNFTQKHRIINFRKLELKSLRNSFKRLLLILIRSYSLKYQHKFFWKQISIVSNILFYAIFSKFQYSSFVILSYFSNYSHNRSLPAFRRPSLHSQHRRFPCHPHLFRKSLKLLRSLKTLKFLKISRFVLFQGTLFRPQARTALRKGTHRKMRRKSRKVQIRRR